jgi:hypothetical protein
MSHFRLCYRDPGQRFNVVIMEAPSMLHARLKAALAARDGGMIFTEGHELGAEMAPLVQPGRVLSADEAMELLSRFKPTSVLPRNPANHQRMTSCALPTGKTPPGRGQPHR